MGHQQTVDKILAWLEADGVKGETICDAGCGVGSLAIPMAMLGAKVRPSVPKRNGIDTYEALSPTQIFTRRRLID